MTGRRSPTVRMKRLGLRLKEEREAVGITVAVATGRLGWSAATLHRLEGGTGTFPKIANVEALLDLYGIPADDPRREELLTLTRQAREYGWWHPHKDAMSESYKTYVGLETEAWTLRTFEPSIIPGLLQTRGYANALITGRTPDRPPDLVAHLAEIRVGRQRLLTAPDPIHLRAVIGEAALRWMVGGADVMTEQLEHLLKAAELPNIDVQILPYSAGAHPGSGPFSMITFREPTDPEVVFGENMIRDMWVEGDDVSAIANVFERMLKLSLSLAESRTRITETIAELRRM